MESTEFDATLGGAEHLPYSANIFKFAASRSVEIAAMTKSVLCPNKTKLIFQNLPVHMRRRVMSHNSKRLPKDLREAHVEQFSKSGLPPKQKRPSRKYRRRPTNLLKEYSRRKRRHIWLETHIWHAKRFHMCDRWGHRLAYSPCDKAFRACYRATSAHCLLQDISYYTPIRIQGLSNDILSIFNSITSKLCGFSISAKAYFSGNREGTLHLYKPNMYPFGYIGKVTFLWIQVENANKELWLFVHPSQASTVQSVLKDITNDISSEHILTNSKEAKRKKMDSDYSAKIIIETKVGSFNRFRLTGPLSQAILNRCLKCVTDYSKISHNKWTAHYCETESPFYLSEKYEYWETLAMAHSPSQVPPKLVLGLVVEDPRLSRPQYRTKARVQHNKDVDVFSLTTVPSFSPVTPLWKDIVRDKIKSNILTNPQFIAHITNTQLIPGEIYADDPVLQSIPIVLIQIPGSQNSKHKKIGYGSGWDIIIPAGYGLPFWLTFIMFGARSGGLRETENLSLEMGDCYMPPDSDAGNMEEKRIETKLKEHYFKRPPSKRVNYVTHGISSPFLCPWKILLGDWCTQKIDDFFVLREKFHINEIQESLSNKKKLPNIEKADHCLVAINLQVSGKGNLKDHALICMPHTNDMKSQKTLCEPKHEDFNCKLRKLKKMEHRKTVKQLKNIHTKLRKMSKINNTDGRPRSNTEPSEYVKQMRELWLPSKVDTVRFLNTRETIGYVSKAAFSFTEAKSCGVGYIAFNALRELVNNGYNQVLVRNTSTLKYRIANIQMIKDI